MILVFSCSCFDIYFSSWALCKNFTWSFVPLLVAATLTAVRIGRRIFDRTAETISIKCQSSQYFFPSWFNLIVVRKDSRIFDSFHLQLKLLHHGREFISLNISCELLHGATLSTNILLWVLLVTLCYQDTHWYQPCWRDKYCINIGK